MLKDSRIIANVPALDLDRAKAFYSDVLGLEPVAENPGGVVYAGADGSSFHLYRTEHAGRATHTIAQWRVDDVAQEVRTLRGRGLEFETFDLPGATWHDGVAVIEGMGSAAWFKDSEGNTMCIDDERTP